MGRIASVAARALDCFAEGLTRIPTPFFAVAFFGGLAAAACQAIYTPPAVEVLEAYHLEVDGTRYTCIGFRGRRAGIWCE